MYIMGADPAEGIRADVHKAEEALERAERGCLIANSLTAARALDRRVRSQ